MVAGWHLCAMYRVGCAVRTGRFLIAFDTPVQTCPTTTREPRQSSGIFKNPELVADWQRLSGDTRGSPNHYVNDREVGFYDAGYLDRVTHGR
jgi:hypothetical protein